MKVAVRVCVPVAVWLLVLGAASAADKVNINTATEAELMKLPGVSEAAAKAIVNYRKNTGELIQLDELQLIPQVKPLYPQLKDKLVLE
jgi:competence protein ComEA